MKNEPRLGIRYLSNTVFFGKMLKDGITISETAKDISDSNFIGVVLEYIKGKTEDFEKVLVITGNKGIRYEITVKKIENVLEDQKEATNDNIR